MSLCRQVRERPWVDPRGFVDGHAMAAAPWQIGKVGALIVSQKSTEPTIYRLQNYQQTASQWFQAAPVGSVFSRLAKTCLYVIRWKQCRTCSGGGVAGNAAAAYLQWVGM